mmetsp:Transcript_1176/g.3479  ORF Transcript_1176/g.3479 Transcript_1176/m.3479 type:complete len:267 (+) Transcript_1176:2595-3395(+)
MSSCASDESDSSGMRSASACGKVTPKAVAIASSQRSRPPHVAAAEGGSASVDFALDECLRRSPSKHGSDTESRRTSRDETTRESETGSATAAPSTKSASPRAWPSDSAYLYASHHRSGSTVTASPKRKHVLSCCSSSACVASRTRKWRISASTASTSTTSPPSAARAPQMRSKSSCGTIRPARRRREAPCCVSEGERPQQRGAPCSEWSRSVDEPRTGKMRSGGGEEGSVPPTSASTIAPSAPPSSSFCPAAPCRCSLAAAYSAER